MIEMTLSSRHRIRNSCPGGLRPSTLPLGHGGSPRNYQMWSKHIKPNDRPKLDIFLEGWGAIDYLLPFSQIQRVFHLDNIQIYQFKDVYLALLMLILNECKITNKMSGLFFSKFASGTQKVVLRNF